MSDCVKCEVYDLSNQFGSWDEIESMANRGTREFGAFTLIDWFFDPMPDDYYGEFSQGHEGDLYMVFKHNETDRFFRKSGRGSSYGDHYWVGDVKEVFPKAVVKTVYEYEEKEGDN